MRIVGRAAPLGTFLLLMGLTAAVAFAQDAEATPEAETGLIADAVEVVAGVGMFDQPIQTVEGRLTNPTSEPLAIVSITADAFDRADTQIGEGFGFPVNACGVGLLDVTLNPGESVMFSAPLEFFDDTTRVERVEVRAETIEAAPEPPPANLVPGIRQIFTGEAVTVEFYRDLGYLIGSGCGRDPFYEWTWYLYDGRRTQAEPFPHPQLLNLELDQLPTRLNLRNVEIFNQAFIRIAPNGDRFVFQDAIHAIYTAALPGRLIRPLHSRLHNRMLQGIYWLPEGRFMAYYYGAVGDPVIYFTADVDGRYISASPLQNPSSEIVPGVTTDGRRVILGGDYSNAENYVGRGYYLLVVTTGFFEQLFAAEPPGNNFPNPVPVTSAVDNLVTTVYVPLEVDGEARLSCFDRSTSTLIDLGALPFRLADDERGQMWLSPDETELVIAVTGRRGGVWVIDRAALSC